VFTVKLPLRLVARVRAHAAATGRTLSGWSRKSGDRFGTLHAPARYPPHPDQAAFRPRHPFGTRSPEATLGPSARAQPRNQATKIQRKGRQDQLGVYSLPTAQRPSRSRLRMGRLPEAWISATSAGLPARRERNDRLKIKTGR
jgi:hypothetical protein